MCHSKDMSSDDHTDKAWLAHNQGSTESSYLISRVKFKLVCVNPAEGRLLEGVSSDGPNEVQVLCYSCGGFSMFWKSYLIFLGWKIRTGSYTNYRFPQDWYPVYSENLII